MWYLLPFLSNKEISVLIQVFASTFLTEKPKNKATTATCK